MIETEKETLGDSPKKSADALESFSLFSLGSYMFGFSLKDVLGFYPLYESQSVPLAPDWIEGLCNDRGRIAVTINLRKRLGLLDIATTKSIKPMGLMVQAFESFYLCRIDKPQTIFTPPEEKKIDIPTNLSDSLRPYVKMAYLEDTSLIFILDPQKVFFYEGEETREKKVV